MTVTGSDQKARAGKQRNGASRSFRDDTRGTIAVMFALLSIPILLATFLAFDFSRAASMKSKLQVAIDAAAITASMRLGEDNGHVRETFKAAFRANVPQSLVDQEYALTIAKDKKSLRIEIDGSIQATLPRIAGIDHVRFKVEAFAIKPKRAISLIARGNGTGIGVDGASSNDAAKAAIKREIQRGLEQARSAGLPVPANIDAAQLDQLAEMVLKSLSRR